MRSQSLYIILLILPVISGCDSCKKILNLPSSDQLPPITQTGARTFGAMVNGQVWVPKGWDGGTSNLTISYDPGYAQGTLNVAAYRIIDTVRTHDTDLGFAIDSLNNYSFPHTFLLKPNSNTNLGYFKYPCTYDSYYPATTGIGSITITKLDVQNGIIAGTFEATLYKTGCDTVTITDGCFDMKLH